VAVTTRPSGINQGEWRITATPVQQFDTRHAAPSTAPKIGPRLPRRDLIAHTRLAPLVHEVVLMDSWIRASDAGRDRVVEAMRAQVGTGRLTLDEFSERSAEAYRARTVGDLDTLTRDLPAPPRLCPPAPIPP
jgi:hypothetical protein